MYRSYVHTHDQVGDDVITDRAKAADADPEFLTAYPRGHAGHGGRQRAVSYGDPLA